MQKYILILIFIFSYEIFAQCGCLSGASASNFSPVIDQTGKFISNKGDLIVSGYYKYGFGNNSYEGDDIIKSEYLQEYVSHYAGLFAKYYFTEKLSAEMNMGYYPQKKQTFALYEEESSGLSNIMLLLNYTAFSNDKLNYSIGGGGLLPVGPQEDECLPQHLLTNGGSYGIILNSDFKYRFEESEITAYLMNRGIINIYGQNDYLYGNTLINSVMFSKIFSNFVAIAEIRNEIRGKDKYKELEIDDSGSLQFYISPKIGYTFEKFTFLASLDYPFYSYYYGKQMGNTFSATFNIYYSTNVFGF